MTGAELVLSAPLWFNPANVPREAQVLFNKAGDEIVAMVVAVVAI